jgi:hypothetical protein
MPRSLPRFSRTTLALAALLALGACATTAPPAAPPAAPPTAPTTAQPSSAAAPAGSAAAAAAGTAPAQAGSATTTAQAATPGSRPAAGARAPGSPPAFDEVIKEATRTDGFIPVWRKDEKVWLELGPEHLGVPMLVSVNTASSVGERGLYASQMGPRWMAEFRRVGNQVQLVAHQTRFRAPRDPVAALAVQQAFSESLLGSTAVASGEHGERKSVLIDASFLLGDMAGYSTALEAAYRLPFAPDRANSYFERVRAEADLTTLSGRVHYAVPRIPAAPQSMPGATPPPRPAPPSTTGDARSLFVGFVYNFRALPEEPMRVRHADPRVGYFNESYSDLSDDLRPNTRVHPIKRWRLEKKDPTLAMSEPVEPITFWLDRNIPQRYRPTIEGAVLEWNKAFERIGFTNAIVVKQQPDDADFDTLDARHASVRWFVGADVGFAIGPSHADPRTGEILDADIGMSDVFGRGARRLAANDVPRPQSFLQGNSAWQTGLPGPWNPGGEQACTFAMEAADELHFALDLLEARGDLDPGSPEAEEFVRAYIFDVMMHEVGHVLGLRHNFKASTTVTREQLKDAAFGREQGITASVMDYTPFNLPLAGEPRGEFHMRTLGVYDYWAIEYGYSVLPEETEKADLQRIAGRAATDPRLAFADDADNRLGLDPLANVFDLGDDPLAWIERRLAMSRELMERVQARGSRPGDEPDRLSRSLNESFRQLGRMPGIASKYVGGMHVERHPAGTSDRPVFRPVDPAEQRRALRLIREGLFSFDSFRLQPEFLVRVSPDFVEWSRSGPPAIPATVLELQRQALDGLLDAGTAQRLLDLPAFLTPAERRGAISLNEVYATVQDAVWSELRSGREIEPMRRNLQREHLRRMQAVLTRPPSALPADAVSLTRLHATELQASLRRALARGGQSVESRAHLQESLALLTEALRAGMQRS